jgi:hypothetical protein
MEVGGTTGQDGERSRVSAETSLNPPALRNPESPTGPAGDRSPSERYAWSGLLTRPDW